MFLFQKLYEQVVSGISEAFTTFVTKRAAGAKNIEDSAFSKGKYSILTGYHFAGKVKPYADALRWSNKEKKEVHFKQKYREMYKKLKDLDSLTQKEFQTISGSLEAYGEVYIQSVKPKEYDK
jgi:hypothetical protein